MKILGVEIKGGVYQSDGYCMYVDINKVQANLNKSFAKARYIEDETEKLKELEKLLYGNDDNKIGVSVRSGELPNWESVGLEGIEDFFKLQKQSMFYGVSAMVSEKRRLQIEQYVARITNKGLSQPTRFKEICYLIDHQYLHHTRVFDHPASDLVHCKQYSNLIYDILQKQINKIVASAKVDVEKELPVKMRSSLVWTAKKTTLGTLFGLLYDAKIIDGTKEDLLKGLVVMFGESKNTLKKALNQYTYEAENKTYYDPEIEKLTIDLIQYLKDSNPNHKK